MIPLHRRGFLGALLAAPAALRAGLVKVAAPQGDVGVTVHQIAPENGLDWRVALEQWRRERLWHLRIEIDGRITGLTCYADGTVAVCTFEAERFAVGPGGEAGPFPTAGLLTGGGA